MTSVWVIEDHMRILLESEEVKALVRIVDGYAHQQDRCRRIATTTRRRNGEEWVDKTNYFTVEAYGGQARVCAEYLRKGSRVFVDAELDWREWTDKQDHRREAVTFRARQVLFESGRAAPAASADGGEQQNGAGPDAAAPAGGEPMGASTPGADESASADDLPF